MNRKLGFITIIAFSAAIAILFKSCERKSNLNQAQSNALAEGRQLSEKYCKSCHLYPGPELLNKESWARVLPIMESEMTKSAVPIGAFEWITIQDYYNKAAPAELSKYTTEELKDHNEVFTWPDTFSIPNSKIPSVTMVSYDRTRNLICTGNIEGDLLLFQGTTLVKTLNINNIPIGAHSNTGDKSMDVLAIGSLLPSEELKGAVIRIDSADKQTIIIDSLKRPVHFLSEDFNNDGREEYLISCFGSQLGRTYSGNLSLFELTDGKYREKIIKSVPGATKTAVGDFDKDGKPDFIALFSQGRESMSMFLNKGNFEFEEKKLLEFLPVYGSNSFELADMNGDNLVDIVFTNGDNFDFSPVVKRYHGVRIFINNGKNEFSERYFFNINGAAKVIVHDFDSDKDPDLFVLAMYPDLADRAWETLVYLENDGDMNFKPSYIEKEPSAKWLVMDAGDIDQDGDQDVVVGSNLILEIPRTGFYEQKWNKNKKSFMALINNSQNSGPSENLWQKIKTFFSN